MDLLQVLDRGVRMKSLIIGLGIVSSIYLSPVAFADNTCQAFYRENGKLFLRGSLVVKPGGSDPASLAKCDAFAVSETKKYNPNPLTGKWDEACRVRAQWGIGPYTSEVLYKYKEINAGFNRTRLIKFKCKTITQQVAESHSEDATNAVVQ